jgi:hypothetical protein
MNALQVMAVAIVALAIYCFPALGAVAVIYYLARAVVDAQRTEV